MPLSHKPLSQQLVSWGDSGKTVTVAHQAPRHIHELLWTYLLPKPKESVPAYKVTGLKAPPYTHTHTYSAPHPPQKTHTPIQKCTHKHIHTLFKMQYSWARRNQANEGFINYLESGAVAHSPEGCCHSVCPNQDQTEGPKPLPYRHQGNNPTIQFWVWRGSPWVKHWN